MTDKFIPNHQFNLVARQIGLVQRAVETASDPKVVESVRIGAAAAIAEAFPNEAQRDRLRLASIADMREREHFREYLLSLEPLLASFPQVTEKTLAKLFPKVKKLKTPDLAAVDFTRVTYLGWTDIAAGRMYLVYPLDGQLVGIEGRFTPVSKSGVCFLCNRHGDVALFTANTKTKPPGAGVDYYKAIGNYLCTDSAACNRQIADVGALETYVRAVTGIGKQ